jgi:hypothetical protein
MFDKVENRIGLIKPFDKVQILDSETDSIKDVGKDNIIVGKDIFFHVKTVAELVEAKVVLVEIWGSERRERELVDFISQIFKVLAVIGESALGEEVVVEAEVDGSG